MELSALLLTWNNITAKVGTFGFDFSSDAHFYQIYVWQWVVIGVLIAGFVLLFLRILRNNIRLKQSHRMTISSIELANRMNARLRDARYKLEIALAKAEESDRLKSAFISNMSHEIRTPLNAITGFSTLIASIDDKKEREEYVDIIRNNGEQLLQLIDDILNIAKLESGDINFETTKVDVNTICMNVVVAYQSKCSPYVSLEFTPTTEPQYFLLNVDYVTKVLNNLVSNAIKFTPSGTITVGYNIIDNNSKLEFYVQDSGIGIAMEKLQAIFERFIKLDPYSSGTGLGLALSKLIVSAMGGEIGATSQVGTGSRFYFTIPLGRVTENVN